MSTNDKQEHEDLSNVASYFQVLLTHTVSDARDAYDILVEGNDDSKYQLSLTYLNLSFQSYLEAKRVYYSEKLQHYELEPFFVSYNHFKSQLKQVVNEKDSNITWLSAAHEELLASKKHLDEFITNYIKSSKKDTGI